MGMNREKLLKAYPSVPEHVKQRMDETLLRLRTESTGKRQARPAPYRKLSVVLAAALVLMTVAAGVAAGRRFGVFDFMTNLFGQGDVLPQAQVMLAADLASVTLEHAKVVIEEAVYDGGNLRLVYSVCSVDESLSIEEAAAADQVSLHGCDWFSINDEEFIMTNGSSFGSILTPEGDKRLCYLDICMASSGIVPKGNFTAGLPLIGRETVSFPVPGYRVAEHPMSVERDGVKATMLSSSLSPIRSYVRLRIEKQSEASAESYEAAIGDWKDALLADGNGSKISAPTEILIDDCEEGQWIELTYIFPPAQNDDLFFVPTLITAEDEWMPDMAHALPMP